MCCPIRYLDKYLIVLLWCIILIAVIMIHFRINHLTSVYMCVCVCHEPLITATFPPPPYFLWLPMMSLTIQVSGSLAHS